MHFVIDRCASQADFIFLIFTVVIFMIFIVFYLNFKAAVVTFFQVQDHFKSSGAYQKK